MDRNDIVNKYLKTHLDDVEGNRSEVYEDQKGIPTIGAGINLRSPQAQKSLINMGHAPEAIQSGEIQLKPEELNKIQEESLSEKKRMFDVIKSQSFPQKELNEAQEASLLSLMYNSPKLVGPNMRQHLNEGRDLDVMREMVLNSNQEQSPGLQLRRIKEAELYGGPLDFQQMLQTLKPEEKKQVFELLNKINNDEQKTQVLQKYSQFDPDYKRPDDKPKFFKLANILKGNE